MRASNPAVSDRAGFFNALKSIGRIQLPDEELELSGREVQYKLAPIAIRSGRPVVVESGNSRGLILHLESGFKCSSQMPREIYVFVLCFHSQVYRFLGFYYG